MIVTVDSRRKKCSGSGPEIFFSSSPNCKITLYDPDEVDVYGLLVTMKELGYNAHVKHQVILLLFEFTMRPHETVNDAN